MAFWKAGFSALVGVGLALGVGGAGAQVVLAPAVPVIGSSNPVSPEPAVARPSTTPCSVSLFSKTFNDYSSRAFSYAPTCMGPWAKVVLTMDLTVSAGRQYDRTGTIFLGGVNIYFGTTAEPRAALSPSWHVERDLTDYSALFTTAQAGQVFIANIVNSTYTGVIYGTATLLFYPADAANPAPATPSAVMGLSTGNATTFVNTTADQLSGTFTALPRNVTRAYLDVISQSQSNDEFWYTCVPNTVADALENCGNTGFRETEVTIDGVPAGVAPVYPWIYTGGIDPYLWEPVTGIETLNFKPYRVDLSPFAGVLSDGNSHTVAVNVFNAGAGFSEAANLLMYTDPNTTVVTGGVTQNTLTAAPNPQVETYLGTAADGTVSGPVNVQSFRAWQISGYVVTAAGRTDTTITANNSFKNLQSDDVAPTLPYQQNINQETDQQETTTVVGPSGTTQTVHTVTFPLVVDYTEAYNNNNDGGFYLASYVHQGKTDETQTTVNGNSLPPAYLHETVETSDTLHYSSGGSLLSHDNNAAQASFGAKDPSYNCTYEALSAVSLKLTGVTLSPYCSAVQ